MYAYGAKLLPTPEGCSNETERDHMQLKYAYYHILDKSYLKFPHSNILTGTKKEEDRDYTVLSLILATKPSDHLVPPAEIMEALKDCLVEDGFFHDPGWFYVTEFWSVHIGGIVCCTK